MWQRPANTIPQLTRKGYQPHGFVWGAIFLIPQLVGIACGIIRGVVWCIWQKLRWDRVCVYVAVWHTLSWIETALQLVWRDSTPNWILDGFKFQASTVSVWWAMGEGGSNTIKTGMCGKDISSFSPQTTIGKCVFQGWPGLPWQHGQYQLLLAK